MSMTPAETLLAKLHESKGIRKAPVATSPDDALSQFSAHIKWLVSRHIKKTYKDEYLVSWCFRKTRFFNRASELNAYCRVNLIVFDKCFDALLKGARGANSQITQSDFVRYNDIFSDYIFDIHLIAEHLEKQIDPNYIMFRGVKSRHVYTWQLFLLSRQLAVQSAFRDNHIHIEHKVGQITSIFALRQALEAKFERLIAVAIYNKNGDTPRLKHGFHHDFIKTHRQYFNFKAVDFDNLETIYQWCNEIVHRVYVPLVWQISYAHLLCKGLFESINTGHNQKWSINNSVEINNLSAMQTDFMSHFNLTYMHGIWALEAGEPEADTI